MAEVTISLGSNWGNKESNVSRALDWLSSQLISCQKSMLYETPEIKGFGPSYCNAVVTGETLMKYDELNKLLKTYEKESGRTSEARLHKEVIIDLDIVIWDCQVVRPEDFSREFFLIGYRQLH